MQEITFKQKLDMYINSGDLSINIIYKYSLHNLFSVSSQSFNLLFILCFK